jgi:hypothetical protein
LIFFPQGSLWEVLLDQAKSILRNDIEKMMFLVF